MPRGLSRLWSRLRLGMAGLGTRIRASVSWIGGGAAFRGAESNRLYSDRWTGANHPDTEIRYALRPLRATSRNLVRNNPYAAGAVEAFADNVVGWEGITCRPQVTNPPNDPTGEPVREVNWELERGWREWCEEYATVDGIESWFETERLIVKSWVADGEVFIRRRKGWDNPYGYAIELIDPDLLDETFNEKREAATGREIVMGVEVDEYGRPLAYHFWKDHPDELRGRERVRVPADEILHLFVRYRTGQTRGFPLFAPVLTTVEMIDGYTEAELVAARYHASKMLGVKITNQDAVAAYVARMSLSNESGKSNVNRPAKMAPGQVHYFAPGEEPVAIDPTHPTDAFDPFLKVLLRGVSRGLHLSYLTLTGDVGEANYSSMRAGLLPERDHWRALQNVVSRRVHRFVYRDFVSMGLLTGALALPSRIASDYRAVEFRGRRWQWVDPENDLAAAEREVKLGLNSRQRLASDRGLDFEKVIDESADDLAYAREAGVYVGGVDTPPPSRSVSRRGSGDDDNRNGNAATATSFDGRVRPSRLVPYTEEASWLTE